VAPVLRSVVVEEPLLPDIPIDYAATDAQSAGCEKFMRSGKCRRSCAEASPGNVENPGLTR
jgi:hypothetical protein